MSRLALIGAGPKTVAVLAKAAVLAEAGCAIPEIHVIERKAIGAHWNGRCGYTDGRQTLGTSPEKDIGFPYATRIWGKDLGQKVDAGMLAYSWSRFLVAQDRYGDWVDRGRPNPTHRQWADYLCWAVEMASPHFTMHWGEMRRLELGSGSWKLTYEDDQGRATQLETDGLVMTGPGSTSLPEDFSCQGESVLTTETFWSQSAELLGLEEPERIAIIGSGETAAGVALALVRRAQADHSLTIVSPTGVTYSRGESYRENKLYTDPDGSNWTMLTTGHRKEFIRRTDRGVFSQHAISYLDQAQDLELVAGRLIGITTQAAGPELHLSYGEQEWSITCDRAVLALGTDPAGPLKEWLSPGDHQKLASSLRVDHLTVDNLEPLIGYDLALRNLSPRLHMPMLAGLSQGPGFPNLSCLGRVSDRILSAYVPLPQELTS